MHIGNISSFLSQEQYDFTHIWDIKLKITREQARQQTKTPRHRQEYGGYDREEDMGTGTKGKDGQTYGDRRFDFGCWACNTVHR